MEAIEIKAGIREETGKGPARRLRVEGYLPAILYGADIEGSVKLSVSERELEKVLRHSAGATLVVDLKVDEAKKAKKVMFKEVTRHPVRESLLHIDFMEVRMDEAVVVEVPIHLVGKCKGVSEGGVIQHDHRTLKAECLPDKIPSSIDIDVTELEIGQSIHVKDLELPEGVEAMEDEGFTLVSILAPTIEAEEKSTEEIEAELAGSFEEKGEEGKEE